MGKFDGYLLCTDLDGTLLRNDKSVSSENLEAIEYFKREGGRFTFITGRMPYYVSNIYNCVKPNAPFGCCNGGGLYDHMKQEYIWKQPIEREVLTLVEYVQCGRYRYSCVKCLSGGDCCSGLCNSQQRRTRDCKGCGGDSKR